MGKEFIKSGGGMKKTVKKMAMGGMGKAVGAKAPPKGSSMPAFAKPAVGSMMKQAQARSMPSAVKQFMSDKLRGGKPVGLGQAMPKRVMGAGAAMANKNLGKAAAGAGKVMKAGGLAAGHKAADGIAKKGKTKAKMVTMGGSTGMKRGGKVC